MTFQPLKFPPGIIRDLTRNAGAGGWYDCDKIRFRNGLPEKLGGWKQLLSDQFNGVCRSLFCWTTLSGDEFLGVGTTSRFYIESSDAFNNITPFRTDPATLAANPLATNTAGTGVVTVTDASHGALNGDTVSITGATTTDGVTAAQLTGSFVITLLDSNSYNITTTGSASSGSTAGGGSAVVVQYEVNSAPDSGSSILGYGSGSFGGVPDSPITSTLSGTMSDSASTFALVSATGFPTASGTTSGAITSISTSAIALASVSDFPNRGAIKIDSEIILYSERNTTSNVLGGITRAAYGTTAAAHSTSTAVKFVGTVKVNDELVAYDTISTNTFSNLVRGVSGTTAVEHSSGSTVSSIDNGFGWGQAPNSSTSAVSLSSRVWSQDNFGEDLLFNLKDDKIFYWDRTDGLGTRGVDITALTGASDAPTVARQVIVSDQSRHVLALGANPVGQTTQDLMEIRFSDSESVTDWTPETTNSAGNIRLGTGSQIIGGLQTRQEILVWTDSALYSVRFVGAPFVFGSQILATGTTIQSMLASATQNDITYWMGFNRFQYYDGSVHTLDCPVIEYVFNDLNNSKRDIIYASTNSEFNEVTWWYCSASSEEIDKYVTYNTVDKAWYFGNLARSAWIDRSTRRYPIAASPTDKRLYEHDLGQDDGENSTAINAYIESADILMGQGETFQFVRKLLPDISFNSSENDSPTATFTLKARNFPGSAFDQTENATVDATQTIDVEQFTKQSDIRLRGRSVAFRLESNETGTQWRLGVPMIEVRPDGRR